MINPQANRKRFLVAYAECGVIKEAARKARVHRSSHWEWLKDPEYVEQFEHAKQAAVEHLEAECYNRAVVGDDEVIVYQGEIQYKLGPDGKLTDKPVTVKRKSDTLLIFLLKAAAPEKYRDTFKAELIHKGIPRGTPLLEHLSDQQLEQLKALATAAITGQNGHQQQPSDAQ